MSVSFDWAKWGIVASVAAAVGAGAAFLWDRSSSLSEGSSKKLLSEYESKMNALIAKRQEEMRAVDDQALFEMKLKFGRLMGRSKNPKEVERRYQEAVRSYKEQAENRDAGFVADVKVFYARLYNEALQKEAALPKPAAPKRAAPKPRAVEKVEPYVVVPERGPLAGRRVHAVPRALLPSVQSVRPIQTAVAPEELETEEIIVESEPFEDIEPVVVEALEVRETPEVEVIRVRKRLFLPDWSEDDVEAAKERARAYREAEALQSTIEERALRERAEAERRRGMLDEVDLAVSEMKSLEDMKAEAVASLRQNPVAASSDLDAIRELQRDLSRKIYRGFGGQDTKDIFKRVFGVDVDDPRQRGE